MADLSDHLWSALDAPEGEKEFHIRQALQLLERGGGSAGEDGDLAVWVPLSKPIYDRIALEIGDDELREDTHAEYIRMSIETRLALIDREGETVEVSVPVDVPEKAFERARLRLEERREKGDESATLDDFLFDYVAVDPEWIVEGEPIEER